MVELKGDRGVDVVVIDFPVGGDQGSVEQSFDAADVWDFLDDFGNEYVAIVTSWALHIEYVFSGDYAQFYWTEGRATFDNDPPRLDGTAKVYPEQRSEGYYGLYHKFTGEVGTGGDADAIPGNGNGETFGPYRPTWPNWYYETFDDDSDLGLLAQIDSSEVANGDRESFRLSLEYVIGELV